MRRGLLVLLALLLMSGFPSLRAHAKTPPVPRSPVAVIAHIDSGINPYHETFRDRTPRGQAHPSTYLPGFPADTPALRLSLDAPNWKAAYEKDRKIWEEEVEDGRLYWIPGTKIVGAVRMASGGVYCPRTGEAVQPALVAGAVSDCPEHRIIDDHGHGTMTATRMGGIGASLCDECRILSIEGLGDAGVMYAAESGWVDVQTNSWAYIAPTPVIWPVVRNAAANMEIAAETHLVYFASGNGLNGIFGFGPWPSQTVATLVKGAIWVGAHDNGRVTAWSGAPAHVVADGYGGLAAPKHEMKGLVPSPFACCSSASSPYAAGAGAAIVLEARRILGHHGVGVHGGVVARGPKGKVGRGPLADGVFTLDELKAVVKHSAEPVPREGRHDGLLHWTGGPGAPTQVAYGPSGNPYCVGCWTAPVPWTSVPPQLPSYLSIGYGAVNERSLDLARRILSGAAAEPDRAQVDTFFENEGKVRQAVQHPDDPGG